MQEWLLSLVNGQDWKSLGWLVVLIGSLLAIFKDSIPWSSLSRLNPFSSREEAEPDGDSIPNRLEVLELLDLAYSYFEAEQCREGMSAVKTAINHVYHTDFVTTNAVGDHVPANHG